MPGITQTDNRDLDRLFESGAHFAYAKSRRHPSAARYLYGAKDRVEIFDLEQTHACLARACAFARKLGKDRKTLLFVSGKPEAVEAVREGAARTGQPYVAGRWIGGTLSNFSEIKKRLAHLADLKEKRELGAFAKHTKRERLLIDRDIERLEKNFGGLVSLEDALPHALFIIDTRKEKGATKEARDAGLPIIALQNSDCNLDEADYPIPANDASKKSITFFVGEVVRAYEEGVKDKELPVSAPAAVRAPLQEK